MTTTPSATWRSPLGILMGARRNDNDNLELRGNYFNPYSPGNSEQQVAPKNNGNPRNMLATSGENIGNVGNGGLLSYASYLPFRSSLRGSSSSNHGQSGEAGNASNANVRPSTDNNSPAAPPRGAFPPPVSNGKSDGGNGVAGDLGEDLWAMHPLNPQHQTYDSTNNYKSSGLPDQPNPSNHHHHPNQPSHPTPTITPTLPTTPPKLPSQITWTDQKSIINTTFNFTNSIIGAGAMGLGGAFAVSGGGISVVCLLAFAYLTKLSLDLIVDLSSCEVVRDNLRRRRDDCVLKVRDVDDWDAGEENDEGAGVEEIVFSEDVEEDLQMFREEHDNEFFTTPLINLSGAHEEEGDAGNGGSDKSDNSNKEDGEKESKTKLKDDNPVVDSRKDGNNSQQNGSKGDEAESSPLMASESQPLPAQQKHKSTTPNNRPNSLNQPPKLSPSDPLFDDDPLKPNEEQVLKRYDSLNMNLTEPRRFSPLGLNTEDSTPVVFPTGSTPIHPTCRRDQDGHPSMGMLPCTYEELGSAAFGTIGRFAVLISKALYSLGCLVAYVVVVKDNFGVALRRLVGSTPSLEAGCDWEGSNSVFDSDRCRRNITEDDTEGPKWMYDDGFLAFWISALIMLPLSCPRTMEPLAKFSFLSILAIVFLVLVVIYLYFTCTNPMASESTFYENWIEIRSFSGFVESLGTFVFTFVCHHTVNLAYETLPTPIRTPTVWRRVSTNSLVVSTEASLAIGIFAYLTFGAQTPSDVLTGYPPNLELADFARLLLCLTMSLTFPLPFLTCREMVVLIMVDAHKYHYLYRSSYKHNMCRRFFGRLTIIRRKLWTYVHARELRQTNMQSRIRQTPDVEAVEMENPPPPNNLKRYFGKWGWKRNNHLNATNNNSEQWWDEINEHDDRPITQPLLSEEEQGMAIQDIGGANRQEVSLSPLSSPASSTVEQEESISNLEIPPPAQVPAPAWILQGGNSRQLAPLWHVSLTFTLWFMATILAIKAPSLGDVLDLVGAFTGTLLAFVLPALFSFKLAGYNHKSVAIVSVGGVVGLMGTISSLAKFCNDIS